MKRDELQLQNVERYDVTAPKCVGRTYRIHVERFKEDVRRDLGKRKRKERMIVTL